MITISTTTEREARAVTELLSQAPAGLAYVVYLLGWEVTGDNLASQPESGR